MGKEKAHYEYIEEGRRPWLYRNGGASVCLFDKIMPYPRRCMTVSKKGAMQSIALASALDIEEFVLSLEIKDGQWQAVFGKEVVLFEKVLQKFASRILFNIRITSAQKQDIEKLIAFLHDYDVLAHAYISSNDANTLTMVKELCDEIARCYIGDDIDKAKALGVEKIWLSAKASNEIYQTAKTQGLVVLACQKAKGQADCTLIKG